MEKKNRLYLHVVITLLFMFGFGFLPPIDPITPLGMRLLGIFIGLIYAWTTTTMIWPSLFGLIAIILSGAADMKTVFADGFGNDTVVFILISFIFAAVVESTGMTNYMASFAMNLRWSKGHPWRFVFVILFGSYVISAVTSLYPVVLIFWTIIYDISKKMGFRPYDKFPTLMIIGVMLSATLGVICLPFRTLGVATNGIYQSLTGESIGFSQWMAFSIPIGILGILVYLLLMKFVFRVDVSVFKQIGSEELLEAQKITRSQLIALIMLIAFIVLALLPSLISKTLLGQMLAQIGAQGILILIVALMLLIRVDGKPLLDFKEAANHGVIWDVIIMFSVVFPLSSYLTAENTGVTAFLNKVIGPIISSQPPIVFSILIIVLATIITNFANNTIVAIIFASVVCSLASNIGINPAPLVIGLAICAQYAFLTPAASAPSAILFGNTGWLRAKDIYKYASISILVYTILTIAWVLFVGNLVF